MIVRDNRLFFGEHTARELTEKFGSPVFIYEEETLRDRCRKLAGLLKRKNFRVNYSCKANGNIALMKIAREEGLLVDAMSPGEILLGTEAGYGPNEILYVPNNVSKEEMRYAVERGIKVSVDSLAQLQYFGEVNPGGQVFVRVNPGIGDGHHQKVITGGKAKFGVAPDDLQAARELAAQLNVTIIGLNMHIGSLFLKPTNYIAAIKILLGFAEQFPDVKHIDFGGGLGIPYRKGEEGHFPMQEFGDQLEEVLAEWERRNNRYDVTFMIEPGRFPVAESCTILTTVHAVKENFGTKYVGTDLGFNLLVRPVMYGAYHEIVVCDNVDGAEKEPVSICGNICETGDLLAEHRMLPKIEMGNTLAVLDAGAYGFAMSTNYNGRLRPAEVLVTSDGGTRVIREKEDLQYLLINQRY